MNKPELISTDSHIMEPYDLWQTGMNPEYADRAPHHESNDEGEFWWCDGKRLTGSSRQIIEAGNPRDMRFGRTKEHHRPEGGWNPAKKIEDMDADGVYGEVVYPTAAIFLFYVPDTGVFNASAARFNNFLGEFCQSDPERICGVGLINLDDIDEAIREIKRCKQMGLGAAAISVFPSARPYDSAEYDKFWAVAEDLQVPLSLHAGTNRSPRLGKSSGKIQGFDHVNYSTLNYWVQISIGKMIFSGVFDRFPNLKTVIVEHDVGWAAYWISRMDYSYTQRYRRSELYRFKSPNDLPSDIFHRNVFVSFQEDPIGIQLRDIIGVENLMWGSDYPHTEGTFPKSREVVAEILQDVPIEEAELIRAGNAAKVYDFKYPF